MARPVFRSFLAVCVMAIAVCSFSSAMPPDSNDSVKASRKTPEAGRLAEAEGPIKQEVARIKALGIAHQPELAEALVMLSDVYIKQAKIKEAEIVLDQALLIEVQTSGVKATTLDQLFSNLSAVKISQKNYPEALSLLKRVLDVRERSYGVDHPKVTETLTRMAELCDFLRDSNQAVKLKRRVLESRAKSTPSDRPSLVTEFLRLALYTSYQGNELEADAIRRRALEIQETTLGPEHPDLVATIMKIATGRMSANPGFRFDFTLTLSEWDKYDGADGKKALQAMSVELFRVNEKLVQRAASILEKVHKPDQPEAVNVFSYLAAGYLVEGDDSRALPYILRVLAIREKTVGADHPSLLAPLTTLSQTLMKLQEYQQAVPILKRMVAIQEALDAIAGNQRRSLPPLAGVGFGLDDEDEHGENDLKATLRKAVRLAELSKNPALRPDEADLAFMKDIGCIPTGTDLKGLLDTTKVEIPGDRINNETLKHFRGLVNLKSLTIMPSPMQGAGSHVSDAGLAHLSKLTALRRLSLQGTAVRGPGLAYLKDLGEIRDLDLTMTRIDDAGLAHMPTFLSLETLRLQDTKVSNASIPALTRLIALRFIFLTRTNVSNEGAANLQESVSGLRIFR